MMLCARIGTGSTYRTILVNILNCTSSKKERLQCYTHRNTHITHTNTHTHTHTYTHTRTLKFQCYLQEELVVQVRMTVKFVATHMIKCKSLWNSQVCNMFGSSTAPDPKTDVKYDTKCCDPQRVCEGMSH